MQEVIDVIESWEKLLEKFVDVKQRDPLTADGKLEALFGIMTKDLEH